MVKKIMTENSPNSPNSMGFDKSPQNTRIVVAMSGGVDSSVVACLLKKQGYEVIGITLQLYDHSAAINKKGSCCAGQDIFDAKRVAEQMDFPHYVLDYEKKFKQAVIEPFAQAYQQGQTPIPCVACNQTVKFSDLMKMAQQLDADCLATGHYIKTTQGKNGNRQMFRPKDESKDQSYFLFATTQTQLNYLRFPLGDISKSETRNMAEEMNLTIAQKSDSQDICFVPKGKYSDIIAKLNPSAQRNGKIIDIDGKIVGKHNGIFNFTIGQRKGLGIAHPDPLYVVDIDAKKSIVLVGPRYALQTNKIGLKNVNWLGDEKLQKQKTYNIFVRVRSSHRPSPAILYTQNNEIMVELAKSENGLARGQACVFYENNSQQSRVLGGGWIEKVSKPFSIEKMLKTNKALDICP